MDCDDALGHICQYVCLFILVSLLARVHKKLCMDFHKTFSKGKGFIMTD